MPDTYDIIIIGGGIIGAAIACNLALKKYGRIAVVERDQFLGNWATAKCAGGIRAQFSSEINVRMSMLSEDKFESFAEEMGVEVQFDQVGYLFLLTSEKEVTGFEKQFEMWRRLGHPTEWLSPHDITKLAPALATDDILAGTFSRRDGIGDPHQFTQGYVTASRRLGVKYLLETEAVGIEVESEKIIGVKTDRGLLATEHVVNAAGPNARKVAAWVGLDLPVEPIKRQIVTTAPLDFIDDSFPMVVDVGSGLYTHKESGGLLLGWADKSTPAGYDESVDPDYTDAILMKGLERIPQLETAQIKTAWGGLYSVTPDHHAILGNGDRFAGLYHAAGFSGHGFMHAPAVGVVMAELICGEPTSIDISRLSFERFRTSPPVEESVVI
ncbi:MAG: FAD-binding oxidoreductase [candidate division Zixibacteria bacterium]|nr:FAD-binding oxidoreductase [candidate division Zixibacteria bacterium]